MKKFKKGGFSRVVLEDGIATKIYDTGDENGIYYQIIREIASLKSVSSSHVISLLEIDYENFTFIKLPEYSMDLCDLLIKNALNCEQRRSIFFQICLGIYDLHSAGIVHRDIKPENVCISQDGNDFKAVLIDFGYSRKIIKDMRHERFGTYCYWPPEIVADCETYTENVDIWSAGAVLGTMCLRKNIFPSSNLLPSQVQTCVNIDNFWEYGEDLYHLITKMLIIEPHERFTITQCLNSSYFNSLRKCEFKDILYCEYRNVQKNDKNRKVLIDWMHEICSDEKIEESTYLLSVNILDKFTFLTNYEINKNNYQLVGTGCLLIANKLNSVKKFRAEFLAYSCFRQEEELFEMEKIILRDCEFNFN